MLPPGRVRRGTRAERSGTEERVKIWGEEVKKREESKGANEAVSGKPGSEARLRHSENRASASQQAAWYHGGENYFRLCHLHAWILSAKCQMLNAFLLACRNINFCRPHHNQITNQGTLSLQVFFLSYNVPKDLPQTSRELRSV